jgi:hypothetical protein
MRRWGLRFVFCEKIHILGAMLTFAIFQIGLSHAGNQIAGI